MAIANPAATFYDAKRMIGKKFDDPHIQEDMKLWPFDVVAGPDNRPCFQYEDKKKEKKVILPEEVSAKVLARLKVAAKDKLGVNTPFSKCVVTVPAYFNDQ